MKGLTRFAFLLAGAASILLAGCGSSSTGTITPTPTPTAQTGTVHFMVSDDPISDWATIGVKVLSVTLTPQGGGTPVSIYTAPSTVPTINLVQLDQLSQLVSTATVTAGTYSSATVTLSANNDGTNCDVSLIASADPDPGFPLAGGTSVPCSQIVLAGATGTAPNKTVALNLKLASAVTVTSGSTSALDLDFDLAHPAFIVEHMPAAATSPTWVVNFNGPVRHHPRPNLPGIILRHAYGQVASVSSDDKSITVSAAFPVHPVTSPETATVVSTDTFPILADATNGTLYYDMDAGGTPTTLTSFSSIAANLPNLYVRIAARYQQDGSLTATRIWSSSTFDKVWRNPEGHVLHVNTKTNVMHISTEDGTPIPIAIGPNTEFYFGANNSVIGTGTAFFDGLTPGGLPNVARGFKVNVTVDPASAASPAVALTVEIDVARYAGAISLPTSTGFNYDRVFAMADGRQGIDSYNGTLDYSTGAQLDQAGNSITGFYWWNFAFPTLPDEGSSAVAAFVSATGGSVDFGGLVGALKPRGLSDATWNDAGVPNTWSAKWAILTPVGAPLGKITSPFSSATNSFLFAVPVPSTAPQNTPAANNVQVDLSATTGGATLVYQVDRQGGVITITPQDISNATTLATVGAALNTGVPVKVFGVPQPDQSIKAYVLFYYTHTLSLL